MLRPRPVPLPAALVVKKGSSARAITSRLMPSPLSLTSMITLSAPLFASRRRSRWCADRVNVPPRGIASRAFSARLSTALSSWPGSASARCNAGSIR